MKEVTPTLKQNNAGSPFSFGQKPSGNAFQTIPQNKNLFNFESQKKDKPVFKDQNLFDTVIKPKPQKDESQKMFNFGA